MGSLRQQFIEDSNGNKIAVLLPIDRYNKMINQIEEKTKKKGVANLRGKLNLSDAQYNDFQKDLENSREGWEKNI